MATMRFRLGHVKTYVFQHAQVHSICMYLACAVMKRKLILMQSLSISGLPGLEVDLHDCLC